MVEHNKVTLVPQPVNLPTESVPREHMTVRILNRVLLLVKSERTAHAEMPAAYTAYGYLEQTIAWESHDRACIAGHELNEKSVKILS